MKKIKVQEKTNDYGVFEIIGILLIGLQLLILQCLDGQI